MNERNRRWSMDPKEAQKIYESTGVPENLEQVIANSWKEGLTMKTQQKSVKKYPKVVKWAAVGVASVCVAFTLSVNAIPGLAASLEDVPVLGAIARVVTVDRITEQNDYADIDISVPGVEGMADKDAQDNINKILSSDSIKVYDKAKADEEVLKKAVKDSGATEFIPANVYQSYSTMTYTNQLLAIKAVVTETQASAYETVKCYNFDLLNNKLLAMSDLFPQGYDYKAAINKEIKKQIEADIAKDPESTKYFTPGEEGGFTSIRDDQSFYITEQGKLVIAFDEYEVGPGSSGLLEFTIPTEVFGGNVAAENYLR